MKLIVGLGNPTNRYARTRHNAGFIVLDTLAHAFQINSFRLEKKFEAEIAETTSSGEKIIFAKPQTFMNHSGEAVRKIMDFYKIPPENITIIHDDLDIELGQCKVATDSSAAGHNGVQDIFDKLGTQKITRVRIGIEGSERKKDRLMSGSDFVLQDFSEEEFVIIHRLGESVMNTIFP